MDRAVDFDIGAIGREAGWNGDDAAIYAAAILAAQRHLGRRAQGDDVFGRLAALSKSLEGRGPEHDGLAYAGEWLGDLTQKPLEAGPFRALQAMQNQAAGEIDTDHVGTALSAALRVLEGLFASRHSGLAPALSAAVLDMFELDASDRLACAFPMTASLALQAAQKADVTFFVGDPVVSMVTALLGLATNGTLTVDRRDPLSGAYLGNRRWRASPARPWNGNGFDHLVSFPPIGAVYDIGGQDVPKRSVSAELLQFTEMDDAWSKSMFTIVSDGFLSRGASSDVTYRREVVGRGLISVTSLPPGILGRSSGLPTSLMEFRRRQSGNICFVDGRALDSTRARVSSSELRQHLTALPWIVTDQPEKVAAVALDQLEDNQFNLSVERYVKSALVQKMEATLERHQVVALHDIAEIIRPQAVKPLRDEDNRASFEALEITTSDIENGALNKPDRGVRFAQDERDRALKSAVKAGDLVISVKGKVGVVGLATKAADLSENPWVISQSFAILRPRKTCPIEDGRILAAILSAPWAEERLRGLAGGSTVPMISMSDLREFIIPIPNRSAMDDADNELELLRMNMLTFARVKQAIQERRERIWSRLWDMPITNEEDVDA